MQEASLRGVRKAQVKLATYYLVRGDDVRARRVYEDMAGENPTRMASIRDELFAVQSSEYWEIIDRGANFDYLSPERRLQLEVFFVVRGCRWGLLEPAPAAPGGEARLRMPAVGGAGRAGDRDEQPT